MFFLSVSIRLPSFHICFPVSGREIISLSPLSHVLPGSLALHPNPRVCRWSRPTPGLALFPVVTAVGSGMGIWVRPNKMQAGTYYCFRGNNSFPLSLKPKEIDGGYCCHFVNTWGLRLHQWNRHCWQELEGNHVLMTFSEPWIQQVLRSGLVSLHEPIAFSVLFCLNH